MKPMGEVRHEIARRTLLAGIAATPLSFAGTAAADDPNSRHINWGLPAAVGTPAVCFSGRRETISYRTDTGELVALVRNGRGDWERNRRLIGGNPAPAEGELFAYRDGIRHIENIVYRGRDNGVWRVRFGSSAESLSAGATGTVPPPPAAGDPVGFHNAGSDQHNVVYRGDDDHLHLIYWRGGDPAQHENLTLYAQPTAPKARGQPTAFVDGAGRNNVIYRSENNEIIRLCWGDSATSVDLLSSVAGTRPALGDPVAIHTAHDDMAHVIYLDEDCCHCELYWAGENRVQGWNLTEASGAQRFINRWAPHLAKPAVYYSAGTNTKHVVYASLGRFSHTLYEIWWTPGGSTPQHVDMTERYTLPPVANPPAAFATESPARQHVVYRGAAGELYEIVW